MRRISLLSALLTLMLISSQGLFAQTIQTSSSVPSSAIMPPANIGGSVDATITQASAPGTFGATSQEFEAAFTQYDNAAADDFVIPAGSTGTTFSIVSVDIPGSPSGTGSNGGDIIMNVYADAGGTPGGLVFTETFDGPTVDPDNDGSFSLVSTNCPPLAAGTTYWLSVVWDKDFLTDGQWFWDRSLDETAATNAQWQNPGNGFGAGCTSWTDLSTCLGPGVGEVGLAYTMSLHEIPPPAVAVAPIPTMGEWALMIFGLLILNLSVFFVYKQQNAIG